MCCQNSSANPQQRQSSSQVPILPDWALADLRGSTLNDETILAQQFAVVDEERSAAILGHDRVKGPCLEFRYYDLFDGHYTGFSRLKPRTPRTIRNHNTGKERRPKYEQAAGAASRLYVPRGSGPAVLDTEYPLIVCEGEKKTLAAWQAGFPAVGISGVWNWCKPTQRDAAGKKISERELIDDLKKIPFQDRKVLICFDSDGATNPLVRQAAEELSTALRKYGATPILIFFPTDDPEIKVGLDDFLIRHGWSALQKILCDALDSFEEKNIEAEQRKKRDYEEIFSDVVNDFKQHVKEKAKGRGKASPKGKENGKENGKSKPCGSSKSCGCKRKTETASRPATPERRCSPIAPDNHGGNSYKPSPQPPKEEFSKCHWVKMFGRSKSDSSQMVGGGFACGSRSCEQCRPVWERNRIAWYSYKIAHWFEVHKSVTSTDAETKKLYQYLFRKAAKEEGVFYIRIPQANGTMVWFSSHPTKVSIPTTQGKAQVEIAEAVPNIPAGGKVSSSRAIAFKSLRQKGKDKIDWTIKLPKKITLTQFAVALEKIGLYCTFKRHPVYNHTIMRIWGEATDDDIRQAINDAARPPGFKVSSAWKASSRAREEAFV